MYLELFSSTFKGSGRPHRSLIRFVECIHGLAFEVGFQLDRFGSFSAVTMSCSTGFMRCQRPRINCASHGLTDNTNKPTSVKPKARTETNRYFFKKIQRGSFRSKFMLTNLTQLASLTRSGSKAKKMSYPHWLGLTAIIRRTSTNGLHLATRTQSALLFCFDVLP